MSDPIAVSGPVECGDVHCTVVCDDFFYGSPSVQDVFEGECAEDAGVLRAKCVPFGPGRERAAGLNDVAVSSGGRHEHVSMHTLWRRRAGMTTVGGIRTLVVWRI